MLTRFSSVSLALVVTVIIFGATVLGIWIGRVLARRRSGLKEPLGAVQAALVGFVALLLAFGLTMAVGRYEARRAAVVLESNAIGTTYLRAQTLAEPMRTESLQHESPCPTPRRTHEHFWPRRAGPSPCKTGCGRGPGTR